MFPVHIDEKLKYFDKTKYEILSTQDTVELIEKSETGKTKLHCCLTKDALVLNSPEKNVLPYLDGNIKGARSCADVFIYTWNQLKNHWDLHIMEFKKTINVSTISKSKKQLKMGIYNARSVSGFLGINIHKIYLYSGFRNDNITHVNEASLSELRASNLLKTQKIMQEWKSNICNLKIDEEESTYPYIKIQLDEHGNGSITI